MKYNFDKAPNRQNTNCVKWDLRTQKFGTDKVLPLWVADMDFEAPDFITEAISLRTQHGVFGYTFRDDDYYQAIIKWNSRRHDWEIEKSHILFSPGIVPAINIAVQAFTKPEDKIIIQPPVYFPFKTAVLKNKRQLIQNILRIKNNRYVFDLDDLKKQIDSQTKMLILCNPHNPGGRVWGKNELEELAKLCAHHNILVISDEIHCDLVFKPNEYTPFALIAKECNCPHISMIAPSKTFNLAGMASASVIISDGKLRSIFSAAVEALHITGGNIFGAVASTAAYTHGEEWLQELLKYVNQNIDYVSSFIKEHIPQISVMRPEATYLIWLDFQKTGLKARKLHQFIIEKAGLGLNAGYTFGPGGECFARINVACPKSVTETAMKRLAEALKSL